MGVFHVFKIVQMVPNRAESQVIIIIFTFASLLLFYLITLKKRMNSSSI